MGRNIFQNIWSHLLHSSFCLAHILKSCIKAFLCLETTKTHSPGCSEGVNASWHYAISHIKNACHLISLLKYFSIKPNRLPVLLPVTAASAHTVRIAAAKQKAANPQHGGGFVFGLFRLSPLNLSMCPLLVPCSYLWDSPDARRSGVTGHVGVLISPRSALELDLNQHNVVFDIIDGWGDKGRQNLPWQMDEFPGEHSYTWW